MKKNLLIHLLIAIYSTFYLYSEQIVLYPVKDTYVDNCFHDKNFNGKNLYLGEIQGTEGNCVGKSSTRNILIMFNIDKNIKVNDITNATLKLTHKSGTSTIPKVHFHMIKVNWEENEVNFTFVYNPDRVDFTPKKTIQNVSGNLEVDITDIVKTWITGTNYGIIIVNEAPFRSWYWNEYYDNETNQTDNRPKLIIDKKTTQDFKLSILSDLEIGNGVKINIDKPDLNNKKTDNTPCDFSYSSGTELIVTAPNKFRNNEKNLDYYFPYWYVDSDIIDNKNLHITMDQNKEVTLSYAYFLCRYPSGTSDQFIDKLMVCLKESNEKLFSKNGFQSDHLSKMIGAEITKNTFSKGVKCHDDGSWLDISGAVGTCNPRYYPSVWIQYEDEIKAEKYLKFAVAHELTHSYLSYLKSKYPIIQNKDLSWNEGLCDWAGFCVSGSESGIEDCFEKEFVDELKKCNEAFIAEFMNFNPESNIMNDFWNKRKNTFRSAQYSFWKFALSKNSIPEEPDPNKFRILLTGGLDLKLLINEWKRKYIDSDPEVCTFRKFAPILHFHSFNDTKSWYPTDIKIMLNQSRLKKYSSEFDFQGQELQSSDVTENQLLAFNGSNYFLEYNIANPSEINGKNYKRVVYCVKTISTDNKLPVLQYWFFYPYNKWGYGTDDHEGDWEYIAIELNQNQTEINRVCLAQHQWFRLYDKSDINSGKIKIKDKTHPEIYIAKGSQAAYSMKDDPIATGSHLKVAITALSITAGLGAISYILAPEVMAALGLSSTQLTNVVMFLNRIFIVWTERFGYPANIVANIVIALTQTGPDLLKQLWDSYNNFLKQPLVDELEEGVTKVDSYFDYNMITDNFPLWNKWKGHWGKKELFPWNSGPTGPSTKYQYKYPFKLSSVDLRKFDNSINSTLLWFYSDFVIDIKLGSPAYLKVLETNTKTITGFTQNGKVEDIENSLAYKSIKDSHQYVFLFSPQFNNNYKILLEGTDDGVLYLDVVLRKGNDTISQISKTSQIRKGQNQEMDIIFKNDTTISAGKILNIDNNQFHDKRNINLYVFNENTEIKYFIENPGFVTIYLMNLLGETVDNILSNVYHEKGEQKINYNFNRLTPGLYFIKIKKNEAFEFMKLLIQ